ncbi:MAG TPA: alpha/beta hydrolase [Bryobacteraceae bacterium]
MTGEMAGLFGKFAANDPLANPERCRGMTSRASMAVPWSEPQKLYELYLGDILLGEVETQWISSVIIAPFVLSGLAGKSEGVRLPAIRELTLPGKGMDLKFKLDRVARVPAIAAFLLLALASSACREKKPQESFSRSKAVEIIGNARKILTPNGIERLEKVQIGGIEQWVSIRGRDRRNPVLLVIHGGPGYVLMPMSWWSSRDWEEYFTVVQWDQRGSGKTYLLNDPQKVGPTMTLARTVADAEEMTTWLRQQLGKKKIFLLAHSAGTYVGLQMAERHPDWLYAYIGVGEMADMPESERRGWRFAMDAARRTRNAQATRELEAIAPYFAAGHPNPLGDVFKQRKWVGIFGGTMAFRDGSKADTDLGELSPDYTDAEIPHLWDGNKFTERYILADLLNHDWSVPELDCPVIFFAGRHDYVANSQVLAEWFERLKAPSKQLVWFENSGHMPMTEEPGKFLISLVRFARPFAERTGDAAP